MRRSLLTIAFRSVRRAGVRSLLYLLVGVVVGCGLQAPILAANLRQREADRLAELSTEPVGPEARGIEQKYGRHSILLLQFPVNNGPHPPGMPRPLKQREAWLSPGLNALADSDATLSSWFREYQVKVLPASATSGAGDLKAYLADDDQGGPSYASGLPRLSAQAEAIGSYQLLGFILFGAVPALAMLLVASRFGHLLRTRRFWSLRTIGVSARTARLLLGFEFAAPMTLGCLLALIAPQLAASSTLSVPLVGRRLYGQDMQLTPYQLVAVLLLAITTALITGSRFRERAATLPRWSTYLPVLPFVLGGILTTWTWLQPRPNDPVRTAAVLFLAVGLPRAVELLASRFALALGHIRGGPVWLVATRSTAVDPRSAGRIAGLIGAGVFAVGIAGPVATATTSPLPELTNAANSDGGPGMLVRADTLDGSRFPIDAVPPGALPVAGLWPARQGPPAPPTATALLATCAEIREMLEVNAEDCTGGPQVLSTDPTAPFEILELHGANGNKTTPIAFPTDRLSLPSDGRLGFEPTIVIPPSMAEVEGDAPYLTNLYGRVETVSRSFASFQAEVIGAAPGYRVENASTAVYQPDSTETWIVLGEMVVVAVVVVSALLGAISDRASRRPPSPLIVAGFSSRMLLVVRLAAVSVCALCGTALAVGSASAIVSAYGKVNGEDLLSAPFLLALAVTGVLLPLGCELVFSTFRRDV